MNILERQMVDHLRRMREEYHLIGIKTEFEGEGARMEELFRLKEITMAAGVPITLKIGGAEALTDLRNGRTIGAEKIVAPMVETEFAVKKFMDMFEKVFPTEEGYDTVPCINVETITGSEHFQKMTELDEFPRVGEVVIGRVDMTRSLGLTYMDLNSEPVYEACARIFQKTKEVDPSKECVMGGISNFEAFDFLKRFGPGIVDAYELRKAIYQVTDGWEKNAKAGLMMGYEFEMLWYTYKQRYYSEIASEDKQYWEKITRNYKNMEAALK